MPDGPKTQTVNVPGVGDVDFPAEMSNDQIAQVVKAHYLKNPDAAFKAAPKPLSLPWFKEHLYNALDSATNALPAAGATVGAIIGGGVGGSGGSILPGAGTVAGGASGAIGGAGIGGMGGEAAKQIVRRWLGYEVPQTSEQAAHEITKQGIVQGGVQAVSEAIPAAAPMLKKAALSQYERALAPTTKVNKAITEKIAPEMIDRGVTGSLKGIEEQATSQAATIKPQLDAAYQATPSSMTKGSGWQVLSQLQFLKNKYIVQGKVANPEAVNAINGIQDIVQQYGPDISPNSLRKLKSIFDDPVAQGGGYAGADLTSKYALKAKSAAANSIRDIMSKANPDVAALNKEISFWLDVQRVAGQSGLRSTGQQGGLVKTLGPLAAGVGGAAGLPGGVATSVEGAALASVVAGVAYAVRTPAWRTTSSVVKDRLANALASGDISAASALLARFGVAGVEASQASDKTGRTSQP